MKFNPVVVDLSHHDDVQDWEAVKNFGILGVINKATEGTTIVDKTYAVRRKAALEHGFHYGAYHFLHPGDPVAQADHFLKVALDVEQPDDLLLALDYEHEKAGLDDAKPWLQRVFDKTGKRPVFYSGFLIKQQLGNRHDPFLAQHRLWLAQFSEHPVTPPNWKAAYFIQFTGDGQGPEPHHVPGIKIAGGVDIDHFGGTAEQLAQEWANGPVMAIA